MGMCLLLGIMKGWRDPSRLRCWTQSKRVDRWVGTITAATTEAPTTVTFVLMLLVLLLIYCSVLSVIGSITYV